MNQDLQTALQNPSLVLAAGPRPASNRNSTKKVSGLMQLGAAVMLGVALLSPLNALAQTQHQFQQVHQQTTEITVQGQEQQADGVDWFRVEVDGRTWSNANAPQGVSYHVPSWVRDGVLRTNEEAMAMEQGYAGPHIEIGDGSVSSQETASPTVESSAIQKLEAIWAAQDAKKAEYAAEYAAQKAAESRAEIAARQDAPSFSVKRNEYNVYKEIDLEGASLEQATPVQREKFVARLVRDAYVEMQAGHTVESPSQRLVDICQHIEDVATTSVQTAGIKQAPEVFQACQSEQMQSNMFVNSVQKGAAYVGLGIAALVAKGLGVAGFMLAGATLLGTGAGFGDRLASRRTPEGQEPEHKVSPPVPKMG